MQSDKELMQMALDALEEYEDGQKVYFDDEIEALRARLAQPEPQPIGWIYEDDEGRITFSQMPQNPPFWEPVYRARKQWQGLTDEEREEATGWSVEHIEAKLKEKNDS